MALQTGQYRIISTLGREITGRQRDRVYAYHEYMQILTGDEA